MTINSLSNGQDIPTGYGVEITTWENDGDNYKTVSVYGLDKNEVSFIVEFCKHFYSENSQKAKGLGNSENFAKAVWVEQKLTAKWNVEDKGYTYDLIGTWCEGEYLRVFSDLCIYKFDSPVKSIPESEFLV